jgi:predicted transcriptional regulator
VTVRDPETIREDIARSREELGDTVEALAAKADVKKIAHEKLEDGKHAAHSLWQQHRMVVVGAAATIAVLLVARLRRT